MNLKVGLKNLKTFIINIIQYVKISFIFDKKNLLDYKDSPIDQGKEKFITLFKERFNL